MNVPALINIPDMVVTAPVFQEEPLVLMFRLKTVFLNIFLIVVTLLVFQEDMSPLKREAS